MSASLALAAIAILPLGGALIAQVLPERRRAWVTFPAALGSTLLVVALWNVTAGGGVVSHQVGGWPAPLGIALHLDGVGMLLLAMTAAVMCATLVYCHFFYRGGGLVAPWPALLLLWAGLNVLFCTSDLFTAYVAIELISLTSVGLVATAGGASVRAALRYLLLALTGSLLYLAGIVLIYRAHGTLDFRLLAGLVQPTTTARAALALIGGGLLLKTALFPLHGWWPPAHAAAPAPVSALLSALVIKASFYIWFRTWFWVFGPVDRQATAIIVAALGAAAVFWGGLMALRGTRLKTIVAYSTVAQVGYLFLVFGLAGRGQAGGAAIRGGLLLLVAHALAKSAAFLSAGALKRARGDDRLERLKGFGQQMPVTTFALGLALVSLVGLPPSGGFVGKWLLLEAGIASGSWWIVGVLVLGGLLAAAYALRVMEHAFASPASPGAERVESEPLGWVALTLALAAVGLGLVSDAPLQLLQGLDWGTGSP